MFPHRFVSAVAAAIVAWTVAPAAADTPRDAPEPSVPGPASDSEAPPVPDSEARPVPDSEARPVPDSEEPPAPPAEVASRPARLYRPVSRYRRGKGWFLGASLGVGSVTYSGSVGSDSETATFFDVRLGGMLTRRLGLSAEFWSDGHRNEFDDSVAITQNSLGVGMTYWITPHLWLKGGLGTARLTMYRNGTELAGHQGVAYTASAGYEIVSRDSLALDLSLRLLGSSFDTSANESGRSALSLHAGITWY